MKKNLLIFSSLALFFHSAFSQAVLRSGPMVGYSTMREVALWVQTSERAEVQFHFTETTAENWRWSRKVFADENCAFFS